jgi:hypothetical protein
MEQLPAAARANFNNLLFSPPKNQYCPILENKFTKIIRQKFIIVNVLNKVTYRDDFIGFPSSRSLENSQGQIFLGFEISIGRFFVTHGFPKSFLVIEFRMIGWQIVQMDLVTRTTKCSDSRTLALIRQASRSSILPSVSS